jgi:hypothetical protein
MLALLDLSSGWDGRMEMSGPEWRAEKDILIGCEAMGWSEISSIPDCDDGAGCCRSL